MRCVRPDETSQTITLHYLSSGDLNLRFSYRKQEYIIPVIMLLRALGGPYGEMSDREVFSRICGPDTQETWLTDRIELLLRNFNSRFPGLRTSKSCLEYLGSKFHVMLDSPEDMEDADIARELIRRVICVHVGWENKTDVLMWVLGGHLGRMFVFRVKLTTLQSKPTDT